jgi:hypothetical protein
VTRAKPIGRSGSRALALAAALLVARLGLAEPPALPAEPASEEHGAPAEPLPDARALAERAEDVMRGEGTRIEATMTILARKRPRSRVLTLRVYDDRRNDRALLRVLASEEAAGTALLKLPPNLWRFSPGSGETTRIPRPSWSEPFLGSDFRLDDLLHGSSGVANYDHRVLEVEPHAGEGADRRAFVVEYAPHPDARASWGRIVAWIDAEHGTPLRVDYYAEEGAPVRTLHLEDLREVAGRRFPHRWVMRRAGAKGAETRIEVDAIRFANGFGAGLFTIRRLAPGAGAR